MSVAAGTYVTPKVRLARPLGAGGMGEVWVADHLTLGTQVAVKVIKGVDHTAIARARFEREALAAARIQNPHVVQIFDYGATDEGQPFIIMELLGGQSLAERIALGPLDVKQLSVILTQTASALATAHQAGIVHRDIKPPNIFLVHTPTGEPFVKVLDFGIALLARGDDPQVAARSAEPALTATGAMIGTPDYMSPEQLLTEEQVTPKSDIWALAVVAYEALNGSRPFTGTTMVALCMAICEGRYDKERVPVPLRPWFDRAFALDPQARFGSVMEAAEVFRALADGGATGAHALSRTLPAPAPSPAAARPAGVSGCAIAALGLVALLGGGGVVWLVAAPHKERGSSSSSASADKPSKKKKKSKKKTDAAEASDSSEASPSAPSEPTDAPDEPETPAPSAAEPDPSPSPAPPSEPPTQPPGPSQPNAPKPAPSSVASECTQPCREVGACQWNGTSCLVGSSADCAQSGACREMGACTKVGGQCRPGSASECAASSRCKSRGDCGLAGGPGGTCAPTSAAHCRNAPACKSSGRCAVEGHNCVPASDADCRASDGCAARGECRKNGMICIQ